MWRLTAADGIGATLTANNAVEFTDADGETVATIPAPFMFETDRPAEETLSNDIEVTLEPDGDGWRYQLSLDDGWLDDPDRQWPVTLDPTVTQRPLYDCMIVEGSTRNYCEADAMRVGETSTGSERRSVIDFQAVLDLSYNFLHTSVDLLAAELSVKLTDDTPGPAVRTYVVPLTESFDDAATWFDRTSTASWSTPGAVAADSAPVPGSGTGVMGGPDVSDGPWADDPDRVYWYPTQLVQDWFDGNRDELGVALRAYNPTPGEEYRFHASETTGWQDAPQLRLQWTRGLGTRSGGTLGMQTSVTDRSTYQVDLGSGNLLLEATDATIAGIGDANLTVGRAYNSLRYMQVGSETRADASGVFGLGWTSTLDHRRLHFFEGARRVAYTDPSGWTASFYRASSNEYLSTRYTELSIVEQSDGTFEVDNRRTGRIETFDVDGRPLAVEDRNGNRIDFGYDNDGRVVSLVDERDSGLEVTYNSDGLVDTIEDTAGRVWSYAYDGLLLTSVTDPTGAVTGYNYTNDRMSSVTDPDANRHEFTHQTSSPFRVTALTRPEGGTTEINWRGFTTEVTDANNNTTTHDYDNRGRITHTVDARGVEQSVTYDASDNVTSFTDRAGGTPVNNTYTDGNLLESQTAGGSVYTFTYNNANNGFSPDTYTSPQGNQIVYDYDAAGNLARVEDALAQAHTIERNDRGLPTQVTDPNGNTTVYSYTDHNLTGIDYPGSRGSDTIGYDSLHRPVRLEDGNGAVATYSYDALDRVVEVDYSDGRSVVYDYDGRGNRISQTDDTGTITTVYDGDSRVVEEIFPGPRGVVSYTYDPVGNLTSMTDATGTVEYGYNESNLVDEIVEPGGATTTFAYKPDVNLLDERRLPTSPATVEAYSYTDDNQIATITASIDGQQISRFDYTYDATLRTEVAYTGPDGDWTYHYDYDATDRLIAASSPQRANHDYGYDAASNRTSHRTITAGGMHINRWYGYDADHQRCWSSGGGTDPGSDCNTPPSDATLYDYDGAGNLTGSSDGLAIAYNDANQTVQIDTDDGATLNATYAGQGQLDRVSANDTTFVSSILGVTGQTVGGVHTGWTRTPTGQLVGQRDDTGRVYYLTDALGSITAVVNQDGQVVNRYRYTPDGQDTQTCPSGSCVDNPWRFAGEHLDQTTGMYKIGARYYQPDHGSWTQPDPIQGRINPTQPGETNPYAYAGCNPVNYTDPTGMASIQELAIAAIEGCLGFSGQIATVILHAYMAYGGLAAASVVTGPGAGASLFAASCVLGALGNLGVNAALGAYS